MAKYLYGLSVQGIQEFIFTTNELKSIIGASEIIKNINEDIKVKFEENIIINAAGNVKLIFDESDKSTLEAHVLDFPKKIKQNAFGITISQAVVKFDNGGLKKAFVKLEINLSMQRNKNDLPLDMSINILKLAPKSAKPVVDKDMDTATRQKIMKAEEKSLSGIIPKNKKNKTAIIHADGNGLGVMIASMSKNLKSDEEIIRAFKTFSQNLENATDLAYANATKGIDEKHIRKVILGGDDMTIICNANIALDFTKTFLSEFEEQTKAIFKNNGLTACAGIAYCNHKYPFHYAVNLAEELCSYSKKHSKAINKDIAPSSLMFHNIQSANFTEFGEYIKKELTLNEHSKNDTVYLNYGPYFVLSQENYSTIDSFVYLTEAFKAKGSPVGRLREWLTILGQNAHAAKERLLRINEMMTLREDIYKKKALENCFRHFNQAISLEDLTFNRQAKKYTPMGDVIAHLSVTDYDIVDDTKECKA